MISALQLAALLSLTQPAVATVQRACSPADTAQVRAALAAEYSAFRAGFMKSAPQLWIDALDSAFTLTLFNGQVMPRSWVEDYVRTNATQFHILALRMEIQSVTVQGTQ